MIRQLAPYYSPNEARELALWIAEETTSLPRTKLLIAHKSTIKIPNWEIILQKLAKKIPVQYVFEHTVWRDLDLQVNPHTLIPRPETALLVEKAEKKLSAFYPARQPLRVLDAGTGSGCIAIALKKDFPHWQVTGIDCSEPALSVAAANAARNQVSVSWLLSDILSQPLPECEVIVSNPPYVCESEKETMDDNVLLYEPHTALFVPDNQPLKFYIPILRRHAPWLFFEINPRFAASLSALMAQEGYTDIEITKDIYGKERIISGRLSS